MLMASAANFGIRRSLPHWFGVTCGFVFLALCIGLGLDRLLILYPHLAVVMRGASLVFLLWLAWKIAHAAPPRVQGAADGTGGRAAGAEAEPFSFFQAMAFQWVNPKVWAMAMTAIAVYAPERGLAGIAAVAVAFGSVNWPSVGVWVLMGRHFGRWLQQSRWLWLFNWIMAALLVVSSLPVVLG